MKMDRNFMILIGVSVIVILGIGWYFFMPLQGSWDTREPEAPKDQANEDAVTTLEQSVLENLSQMEELAMFVTMAKASAEVTGALSSGEPVTIFVPTNTAFEKLPEGTYKKWFDGEDQSDLVTTVKMHIVSKPVKPSDIADGLTLETMSGKTLTIAGEGEEQTPTFVVNGIATIQPTYIQGTNGYIYLIDTVLVP